MKVYDADIADITGNTIVHRLVKAVLHSEAMEEIAAKNNTINLLQTKLFRLTSALYDAERAEKVAKTVIPPRSRLYIITRSEAINDYRVDILTRREERR